MLDLFNSVIAEDVALAGEIKRIFLISSVAAVIVLAIISLTGWRDPPRIAFVDTQQLMGSFRQAHQANLAIKEEREKGEKLLGELEEKIRTQIDSMSKIYNTLPPGKQREMEDRLAALNGEFNRYNRSEQDRLEKFGGEKMADVLSKVNAFLKEYGDKQRFDIIFGTGEGSIVYGSGTRLDITSEVADALNARFP